MLGVSGCVCILCGCGKSPYALHACLLATWGLEILLNASLAAGVDAVLAGAAPLLVADLGAAYDATAADGAAGCCCWDWNEFLSKWLQCPVC